MSNPVYQNLHNELLNHTKELALDATKEAGKEEAIDENSVTY